MSSRAVFRYVPFVAEMRHNNGNGFHKQASFLKMCTTAPPYLQSLTNSQNFLMPSPKSTSMARVAFSWKNSVIKSSHHSLRSDSEICSNRKNVCTVRYSVPSEYQSDILITKPLGPWGRGAEDALHWEQHCLEAQLNSIYPSYQYTPTHTHYKVHIYQLSQYPWPLKQQYPTVLYI